MFQKIKYDGVWLCSGPQDRLKDVQVNGTQTVQVAQFLRAASVKTFGRGNRVLEVAFTVTRSHVSLVVAQKFLLSHPSALSKQGCFIGYLSDGSTVILDDAVVKSVSQECAGIFTSHRYVVAAGAVSFSPELPTEDIMYTGTVIIPQNSAYVEVSGLGLPGTPRRVWGSVRKPDASSEIMWASVRNDSISPDGFIFDLSGSPSNSNHKLDFCYIL